MSITERIQSANQAVANVGADYIAAIKCSGISAADYSAVFAVRVDDNITNANTAFKNEKTKLEQEIATHRRNIDIQRSRVDSLNNNIRNIDSTISSLNQQIRTAGNQVDDYRRQANRATNDAAREEAHSKMRSAERRRTELQASKRTNEQNRTNAVNQRNAANNIINELSSKVTMLERRLGQVINIIGLF